MCTKMFAGKNTCSTAVLRRAGVVFVLAALVLGLTSCATTGRDRRPPYAISDAPSWQTLDEQAILRAFSFYCFLCEDPSWAAQEPGDFIGKFFWSIGMAIVDPIKVEVSDDVKVRLRDEANAIPRQLGLDPEEDWTIRIRAKTLHLYYPEDYPRVAPYPRRIDIVPDAINMYPQEDLEAWRETAGFFTVYAEHDPDLSGGDGHARLCFDVIFTKEPYGMGMEIPPDAPRIRETRVLLLEKDPASLWGKHAWSIAGDERIPINAEE